MAKPKFEKESPRFDFGANILRLRDNKSLSQDELGALVGVSGAQIGKYESNENMPRQDKVWKLCQALGVEEPELRGWNLGKDHTREGESNGTGSMMIPFFDAVAVGGFGIIADQSPVKKPVRMVNPGTFFRNAEGALQITGHSMFPKYPSGCIVAYKIASLSLILWGEDYVIELATDRRLILKRIEKSDLKDHVKAVSYNVNKDNKYVYDPIDIPRSEISRIFMVLGKIELEAMQS